MVEAKFTFFEMEVEVLAPNAATFGQARLGRAPKAFDAIDVDAAAADEDALAMFDAKVFAVAEVDQAVVAEPAVGVDNALEGNAAANNAPQCGLFRIGDDLRVDAAAALKDPEHDGLAASAAAPFPADPPPTEVRLIDLDDAPHGGMGFTFARHPNAKRVEEAIDGAATDVGELRHFRGLQIKGEEAHDLAKFRLRNM